MAKVKKLEVIKDGIRYYTSTHFAEQVHVTERTARKFLENWPCIPESKNPKLYTKEVMEGAIYLYSKQNGNRIDNLLLKEEELRASAEEDAEREYLENFDPEEAYRELEEVNDDLGIYEMSMQEYKETVNQRMLQSILSVLGYEFNEELYKKDLEYKNWDVIRVAGDKRSLEVVKAFKRLENNDYLQPAGNKKRK